MERVSVRERDRVLSLAIPQQLNQQQQHQSQPELECPICGEPTVVAGTKHSALANRAFELRHCSNCYFTFVSNPWTEYSEIYDEAYYRGRGSDPLVDYVCEMEQPEQTIRSYEWDGVLKAVTRLTSVGAQSKWLDFGCGNGMLAQYVRARTGAAAVGFEEGWIADRARSCGNPLIELDELSAHHGTCDVVTAIEVLEHVADPLPTLRTIRKLLKPGGLFFFTTGNAQPHRGRIADWSYCMPEVHISFFEPRTMELALQKTGFRFEYPDYLRGYSDIIRFKALKSLGYRSRHWSEKHLPWGVLSRVLYSHLKLLRMPVAWAL